MIFGDNEMLYNYRITIVAVALFAFVWSCAYYI